MQRELLGYIYADIDGAFGRFHDGDRDLLAMLASQAAVALANVRFAEGLERKVDERTAELEQRAGELTIINSIQQGIAGSLDFQAIVDLVGDKLREVLKSDDIGIQLARPTKRTDARPLRLRTRQAPAHPAIAPKLAVPANPCFRRAAPIVYNTVAEQLAAGVHAMPGTDQELSLVYVPIIGSDRVLGAASAREPRARARLRRIRGAPAARRSPRAWAWRWRTRASSTRRSGC